MAARMACHATLVMVLAVLLLVRGMMACCMGQKGRFRLTGWGSCLQLQQLLLTAAAVIPSRGRLQAARVRCSCMINPVLVFVLCVLLL